MQKLNFWEFEKNFNGVEEMMIGKKLKIDDFEFTWDTKYVITEYVTLWKLPDKRAATKIDTTLKDIYPFPLQ